MTSESKRLAEARDGTRAWKLWGPYLSERQWGTVREDYSADGNAWAYFPHDQARSRAYKWGEDGLAGISDEKQRLCFAAALWNGRDPILKERLFGLTNSEGNHGEDVKEYYFYLDSTPTHSYMRYLYKYPQSAYPYDDLVRTNGSRSRQDFEYELIDTGVFDENRYFDVQVEYAKRTPDDVFIKFSITNRGPEAAPLHLLPTLWLRNTWSEGGTVKPTLKEACRSQDFSAGSASHPQLDVMYLYCDKAPDLLFTENETNLTRLFDRPNQSKYVKDAFHEYVIGGRQESVSPFQTGTKMAAHYRFDVASGSTVVVRLRLTPSAGCMTPFAEFDETFRARQGEADLFYESITPPSLSADERNVMRQALAGMLWSKQYYYFDLDKWLRDHGHSFASSRRGTAIRNSAWLHMLNDDVISMPDKWEYPWYAAWDLAFHTVALAMVDSDFAKQQLELMLAELYLHPSGQLPAYEWNFGDVNPPVHAWAALMVFTADREMNGKPDYDFLSHCFQKLLINFSWWVNRKDRSGANVFEGGFLGLDNIGVFDRSAPLPTGGSLEQADGTAWMALFCQNMLEIASELVERDPTYEVWVKKFAEHFLWIAGSMDRMGENEDTLWDEEDGFFYDVLRLPDGSATRIRVRSLVGLLPLCATTILPQHMVDRCPEAMDHIARFVQRRPELVASLPPVSSPGENGRRLLAVLDERKLRSVLTRMLDETRFFSPYGIRSLSKWHEQHPFIFDVSGHEYRVEYNPAESDSPMFGGNSNWRGPVWMPVNLLIVRALMQFYLYYGDSFRIECPTGSGHEMNLFEVAREISRRLSAIFLKAESGERPLYGNTHKFQSDPYWSELLLFYEYFHGENGAGLGASHQTGWTGCIARLIQVFAAADARQVLTATASRPLAQVYCETSKSTSAG